MYNLPSMKVLMVEMEIDWNQDGPNVSVVLPLLDKNGNNAPGRDYSLAGQWSLGNEAPM